MGYTGFLGCQALQENQSPMRLTESLRMAMRYKGCGGNFGSATLARVGHRFASALVSSTLEGGTLYKDALYMLGASGTDHIDELGRRLGIVN